MKLLHASDTHLGQGVRGEARGRASSRELFFLVFEDLLTMAEEEEVDLLLLAGDILESSRIEPADVRRLRSLLEAPRSFGILAVAGNHDPLNDSSPWLDLAQDLPNFYLFSSRTIERIDVPRLDLTVYGTSFHHLYEKSGLLPTQASWLAADERPLGHPGLGQGLVGGELIFHDDASTRPPLRRTISLIHGDMGSGLSIEEATLGHGYNRLRTEDIRQSGVGYVALGHYHLAVIESAGDSTYAYCGTPQGAGFDELGVRGALLGTWQSRYPELVFQPLMRSCYEQMNISLDGLSDDAEVAEAILKHLQEKDPTAYGEHRYKITLLGERMEDYRPDLKAIELRLESQVTYLEIQDLTRPALDLDKIRLEEGLRGAYVRALDTLLLSKASHSEVYDPEEVYNLALRYGLAAMGDGGDLDL